MRTNEERIAAMHERAEELNRQQKERKTRIIQWTGVAFGFAAAILLAIFLPGTASFQAATAGGEAASMHASVFGNGSALGFIVIAIIAFLLGAAVTVFCFRLKRWKLDKNGDMK